VIELANQKTKFIRARDRDLKTKIAPRRGPGRETQLIDRLGHQPADHDRRAKSKGNADRTNENGKPLRIGCGRRRGEG
jgi:hypothetical protein